MTLAPAAAFAAYEAVRPRLPAAAARPGPARRVATLAGVAAEFDVFLLDAFGVLNIGETAIPGTRQRIDDLRAAGKRVMVLTNAASVPIDALVAKYRRLGYDFGPADIVTSRATLAAALTGDRAGMHWGAMGESAEGLADLGLARVTRLGDDPAAHAAVDGILLIGSGDWTERRQALLEAALLARPRPVLVANPDIVAPRETGFSAEPGHFAHRLADRTGIVPEFYGKPFANIYDLAFARLGPVDRRRVLMVGDSLHTDILGAQAAGIASALVTGYGFLAGQDAGRAIARSGIVPDILTERP